MVNKLLKAQWFPSMPLSAAFSFILRCWLLVPALLFFVRIYELQTNTDWYCLSSDNLLEIDIFYGQLKSEEVQQREAYDVISFFSE